ncbi:Alkaline phosphatase synthesis transcriptional regulatory protein PhoP [Planctomycetes bacterium Pan216]|uniref:Alkaline phosphatase synthesis transcriptional regulatory protein PhoP n=1 Tax=Kolteria novifilia TaxID=2527975 RepID=A0A518B0Z1_9BACT|nr:Alkaline phosphatase synthesis transcriptional regulatory protein PhoP [Planctomycetes bacterium Pan216]
MMSRIVVIDDDEETLKDVEHLLDGHQIAKASHADEGIKLAEDGPFDLLICDLIMPDHDGLEVVREFRQRFNCGILVISETPCSALWDCALMFGADRFLRKPLTQPQLAEAVEDVIEKRQLASVEDSNAKSRD